MPSQDEAVTLRTETGSDLAAISTVHRCAFPTPLEAELVDRLRTDGDLAVSLVAEIAGNVVGHVAFSRAAVTGAAGTRPVAWLAPLAVVPAFRRRGIGEELTRAGLEACRAQEFGSAVVVGDPGYYARFGFSHDAARKLRSRWFCDALLALSLDPEAKPLVGALVEPRGFSLLA